MQLHIPDPCNEKWVEMPPLNRNCRHCAVCDKSVIDFTGKTDAEILAVYKNSKDRVCGRFRPDQLDRPLRAPLAVRRGGLTAMAAGFAALLLAQDPSGKPVATLPAVEAALHAPNKSGTAENISKDSMRTISGRILSKRSKQPIADCYVQLDETSCYAFTDSAGFYSIRVRPEVLKESIPLLRIHLYGYKDMFTEIPAIVKREDVALKPVFYKLRRHKEPTTMGCPRF